MAPHSYESDPETGLIAMDAETHRAAHEGRDPHPPRPPRRRLPSDAARAVGRFDRAGVRGYRAASAPSSPLRPTRVAAERDELAWLEARRLP